MSRIFRSQFSLHIVPVRWPSGRRSIATLLAFLLVTSATALAQSGSPFDTGFTAIQTLFTGTVAKVASLVAIVIGGYGSPTENQAQKRRSLVWPLAQESQSLLSTS